MKGGGGGEGQDQNSFALLWAIVAIIVLGFITWHFFSDQFIMAFLAVKKAEVTAIAFFIDSPKIQTAILGLNMANPQNVTMEYATAISKFTGSYLIYPVCFILIVMGIIMLRGSASMRFTKTYNMDSLAKQEKNNWPQISPVVDLDLVDTDISKGPWAMSMNPMQFAKHYKLLKIEIVADRKSVWKAEGVPKATVIKSRANQVFSAQVGPLWSGVNQLPAHTKALFAIFAARIEHDTDTARNYLYKLSSSAAKGEIDYSETEVLLKKHANSKAVQKCVSKHAYVLTIMASMLVLGRSDGVLASADFLWVKPLDRRLWYILNSIGRQVAVPEVGGIFAHWLAEKEMGRPLTAPMIEEATKALELAISNMLFLPEDMEEMQGKQNAPSGKAAKK